jgi:hypothetical protein
MMRKTMENWMTWAMALFDFPVPTSQVHFNENIALADLTL